MHFKSCFYVIIFLYFCSTYYTINIEYNIFLNEIITSLEKIIQFYKKNLQNFNLDGIFGLRILQGEVNYILSKLNYKEFQLSSEISDLDKFLNNTDSVISRLRHLYSESHHLSEKAIIYVQQDDITYYNNMKYFIENEWKPIIIFRTLNKRIKHIKGNDSLFGETFSDSCLSDITKYELSPNVSECKISSPCRDYLLLQKGLTGYFITHQVLYATIIQKSYCLTYVNNLLWKNKTSIEKLLQEFCSQIYLERNLLFYQNFSNTTIYTIFDILPKSQDLFLEQVFVCGSIGFMDFVNIKFLKTILSWLSSDGCFKLSIESVNKANTGRSILEEVYLTGGCLAHKTALGLAALTLYLRLFLGPHNKMINILQNERLQFERQKSPDVLNDQLTLQEVIDNQSKMIWISYYNKSVDNFVNITKKPRDDNFKLLFVILSIVIVFLLLRKRCLYICAKYFLRQMKM